MKTDRLDVNVALAFVTLSRREGEEGEGEREEIGIIALQR